MSYLRVGAGPPLLFLPGLTSHHLAPEGMDRHAALGSVRALGEAREVWWVNRRAGLTEGAAMADLAADYATAIPRWFGEPVDVLGLSTGGSVALQLAADHPALVRRLVVVSAAARLSAEGRSCQRRLARALRSGDRRTAGAAMMRILGSSTTAPLWAAAGWLLGPMMFRHDPTDLLATIQAEDGFDLTGRLAEVTIPVLVVGGDQDSPYGPALFARTADGLPAGRLLLYRHTTHAGVLSRKRFGADVLRFLAETSAADGSGARGT
jgi:pimeloyl-ACP methyl ester carboxylesterase